MEIILQETADLYVWISLGKGSPLARAQSSVKCPKYTILSNKVK
jgi:hypothetical protein